MDAIPCYALNLTIGQTVVAGQMGKNIIRIYPIGRWIPGEQELEITPVLCLTLGELVAIHRKVGEKPEP